MVEQVRISGPNQSDEIVVEVMRTFGARLKGLLCTSPAAGPILLVHCGSIHTYGMRYPIDVALVNEESVVVGSWQAVMPGQILSDRDAVMAIERPTSNAWWPARGDRLLALEGQTQTA